ncbi:FAD/NAD(P)-binding oxidoreductase family protein [Striga hermonthica]|uniref:FAD/NAD(P)-binding oxidoreductase family protein n=1 Tax=Striga hermonthica TaxID=68872 RepID=A0A9N7NH59_STRHE|nr:FAD/NAD(P)-binding oxidoreductase family protein [Striga hermonthica]
MGSQEDIVIVGGGVAGLATSLGLHRLGIKSLVLESADELRTTGFAFIMWSNAWKALDALGIGNILRAKHNKLHGIVTASVNSGVTTSELSFVAQDSLGGRDIYCVNRRILLETMENELPKGSVRYSSKVVCIENDGPFKSLHLADGTIVKAKVLIGCDGVNSKVAKFLGFSKPFFVGRSAVRGFFDFEEPHGFEPKVMQFFGKGVRYGVVPCDDHGVYWFFTFSPSPQEKDIVEDPTKLKQLILSRLGKVPDKIKHVVEKTELQNMVFSPLRSRRAWELVWGNISKDNVCVLGDALHPMTPDMGQGGCSALEDSVVLARFLAEAMKGKGSGGEETEEWRVRVGLEKFARERKWRDFDLVCTSYAVGFMQQSDGVVMNFVRDRIIARFLTGLLLKKTSYDCGKLV